MNIITRLFDSQPPSALAGIKAYLVFSSLGVELKLWDQVRPDDYFDVLSEKLKSDEGARDEALEAAKTGNTEKCIKTAQAAESPILKVFFKHDDALAHVNAELSRLEGTQFNDIYTEERFGNVAYIGIYMELS